MENISIREARVSDAGNLIDYLKCVMGETKYMRMYPEEVTFTIEEEERFIKNILEQENSTLIVATDGELIVSVAGVHGQQLKKFKHCAEFGVSVLKKYWGRGLGKEMTIRMIQWCKDNPVLKKLVLHVNAENLVAIDLYEKLGFSREGILHKDFYYEGRFVNTYIYGMTV